MRHDVIRQVVRRAQSLVGLPVEPTGKRSVLQLELFGPLALKSRQVLKLPAGLPGVHSRAERPTTPIQAAP